jgi:hypothetical protein
MLRHAAPVFNTQDIVVGSRGCSEVLTAVKLWLLCVERNDGRGGEMEGSGLRSD